MDSPLNSSASSVPLSPSDYAGVSMAASDLRNHHADEINDFSSTQEQYQEQTAKESAADKAQQFRSYAGEKAASIKQEASMKFKQGAEKAKEIHSTAEEYVRENPTKSVLTAVGVGVIIGLILRR